MTIPTPVRPHQTRTVGGVQVVTKSNETLRLSAEGGTVWLQGGRVFDDGGFELKELPDWFAAEFKKLSPTMQEAHALGPVPEEAPAKAKVEEGSTAESLHQMTKAELLEVAALENVDLASNDTKNEIINKILAGRGQ